MYPSPRRQSVCLAHLIILTAIGLAPTLPSSAQKKPATISTSQTELSAITMQQIAAFSADKEMRTAAQKRIDSNLLYEIKMRRKLKLPANLKTLRTGIETDPQGMTLLDAQAIVNAGLLNDIQKNGGKIVSSSEQWHTLRFWYPLDKLEKLAEHAEFRWIRPAIQPFTNIGSVTSEGDITHRADYTRSFYSLNGNGVKVGVMSDSMDFFAHSQSTGDLGTIYYIPGQAGSGTGEGTAMMEIVHDLAPGAALYFATGQGGHAQFAANIRALRDNGCQIIVDDLTYADESPFQDDVISQAVQDVANSGVLYFSSASNSGNLANNTSSVWEGNYADSGQSFTYNGNNVGRAHTFGSSPFNAVQTGGSQRRLNLFWSDALGHSGNDYDVYVLDASNNVLALSNNTQDGNDDPYEAIGTVNPGERILIVGYHSPAVRYLHLNVGRGRLQYATSGRIQGHNGTANMLSVAAVDVHTTSSSNPFVPAPFTGGPQNPVEAFSSEGPRRMFYNTSGTAYTPSDLTASGGIVLNKPDIAAADGVVTTFPSNSGLNPFYGTSAAAPHAAAIAALLKSYNPNATATQISTAMINSARDIMYSGWDTVSGVGIVTAFDAIGALIGGDDYLFPFGSKTGVFPIDNGNQTKTYAITLEDDKDILEFTAACSSGLAVNLYLFDQNGTTLRSYIYGGYGGSPSVSIPHPGPGTYFVRVDQSAGHGSYTITNSQLTPAPTPTDNELDDTYQLANSLPYLGEKKGRLGYSRHSQDVTDDYDYYKVTVTEEGDLTVSADALYSSLAVNLYVYDQDGTTLLGYIYGGYGASVQVPVPHIGPGTYYILVQNGGGFGQYRISNSIVKDPIPSDQEPNDDVSQALNLPFNGNVKGRLGYSRLPYSVQDETDWYKVTVTGEGDFSVTAAALTSGLAVNLYVYDQDKTTLLGYLYGGYGASISVPVPHLGPGTYYVQVQRGGGYGSYQLSNHLDSAPAVEETEINDTADQANALTLNGAMRGKLGYSRTPYSTQDEADWYKVNVTGDGDWAVSAAPDGSALAVNLYIYDQDKTTLLGYIYGGYGATTGVSVPHIGAGTYYVLVQRAGGYGRYIVSNAFAAQTVPNDAEINDTPTTANVMASLYPRTGHLGYSRNPYSSTDDFDWYQVSLSGGITFNVLPTSGLTVNLVLNDASGNSAVPTVYGTTGSLTTLTASGLASGTYYFGISRAAGYGAYNLTIPAAAISGTLTLEGIAANAPAQQIDFVFRPSDNSGDFIQTASVLPNGAFSFSGIPRKNYTIHIKGTKYLAKNVTVNATSGNVSGVTALMRAGDSNNDNSADITDLLALIAHYNQVAPNAGYSANVDFNLDGIDDIADLLMLIHNYNQRGDN